MLYNRLLSIQATYGVAPDDPVQNYGSYCESRFAGTFGMLYVMTGDATMKSLYETHRDYMLADLDRGYCTAHYSHHGSYTVCAGENNATDVLFDVYRNTKDSKLYSFLNQQTKQLAGLADSNNWPWVSDDSGSGTVIPANCLNGVWEGILNQEVTIAELLTEAYFMEDFDIYHWSGLPERLWNVIKFISYYQNLDGSFPQTYSLPTDVPEVYNFATATWIAHIYILLEKYGDLSYNGDSIMGMIKGAVDKFFVFYQKHYGMNNISVCDGRQLIPLALVPVFYMEGHLNDAIRTAVTHAYAWSRGFYSICPYEVRRNALRTVQRLVWYGNETIHDAYRRWL